LKHKPIVQCDYKVGTEVKIQVLDLFVRCLD